MAGEIQIAMDTSALNLYAHVWDAAGLIWNGSAFEAYATANIATYNIAMTEKGTASRYYVATFPGGIGVGTYQVSIQQRAGGSPAESDVFVGTGSYEWGSSALIALGSRLAPTSLGATLNVDGTGHAAIDWSDISNKTTVNNLSGTTIKTATDIATAVAAVPAAVWASASRTLTSFGTLVSDISTAVWAAGTRELTSFGTLVADIWAFALWSGWSVARALRKIWAESAGKLTNTGSGGGHQTFYAPDGTTMEFEADSEVDGDRTPSDPGP